MSEGMLSETDHTIRVPTISGPSSYGTAIVGRWVIVAWFVAMVMMVVVVVARPREPGAAYFALLFSVVGAVIVLTVAILAIALVVQIQTRRESKAGFTWLSDTYQNLPQIDPVSRRVIRAAGEDFLSSAERKERIAVARRSPAGAPD